MPVGDKLREKLRGLNGTGERLRLDGLSPPAPAMRDSLDGISVEDARKLLKVSQVEKLKWTLRQIPKNSIPYSEFIQICVEVCSNKDQGAEFAKMLDESGSVIVLGNIVFLRPEQVSSLFPVHFNPIISVYFCLFQRFNLINFESNGPKYQYDMHNTRRDKPQTLGVFQ